RRGRGRAGGGGAPRVVVSGGALTPWFCGRRGPPPPPPAAPRQGAGRRPSPAVRGHRRLELDQVDEGVLAGDQPVGRDVDHIDTVEPHLAGHQSPVKNPVVVPVQDAVRLEREVRKALKQIGKRGTNRLATADGLNAGVSPELRVLGVQGDDRVRVARFPCREIAPGDRLEIEPPAVLFGHAPLLTVSPDEPFPYYGYVTYIPSVG